MKNRHRLSLLLLVALGITACAKETDSASSTGKTSDSPISETASDADTETTPGSFASGSADSSAGESVESPVTSDSESGDSSSESTSEDPIDTSQEYYREMWGDDVADIMVEHLEYIVPYIDIGRPLASYTGKNDTWYVEVAGTKDLNSLTIAEWKELFTKYFEADGFVVTSSDSITAGFKAEYKALGITVTLTADEAGAILRCYYVEPFDPTATTDWNDEVKESFTTYTNGNTIPFVYLGTKKPFIVTGSSSDYSYRIYGGKWDDRVENLARTAFGADTTWILTDVTNSNTQLLKATKKFDDGTNLQVILAKSSSIADTCRASLLVKVSTSYDISESNGKYDDTTLSYMNEMFGHEAPYVYLGANTLICKSFATGTTELSSSAWQNGILTFEGGDWDDHCVESIYEQLTTNAPELTWTEELTNSSTTGAVSQGDYVGTDSVGNKWFLSVYSSSSKIRGVFSYAGVYKAGSETSWGSDVTAYFDSYFDGHALPYMYLGERYYVSAPKASTQNGEKETSTIYSMMQWDDSSLDKVISAFENDTTTKWELNTFDYHYSQKIVATATFDDGASMEVTYKNYKASSTMKSRPFDRAQITIDYMPPFDSSLAGTQTSWSSSIQTYFKKYTGNHALPFVWLNTKSAATASYSTGLIKIKGGVYCKEVFDNFLTTYKEDSWTVESDQSSSASPSITVSKLFSDGYQVKAKLYVTSKTIYLNAWLGYESAPTSGAWKTKDKTYMTTNLKETLPYIFLGSFDTTSTALLSSSSYNKTANRLQFKGGYYESDALDLAKKTLEADVDDEGNSKWSVNKKDVSGTETLQAVKANSDGSELKLVLYKYSSLLYMDCYYEAAVTYPDTTDAWSDDITQVMKDNLGGNVIPALYLGSGQTFTVEDTKGKYYQTNGVYIKYAAGASSTSNQYLKKAAEVLEADGYTATYIPFADYRLSATLSSQVEADKTLADGSKLHVRIAKHITSGSNNSSTTEGRIIINYTPAYDAPTDEASKVWNDTIKTMMTENLNGNVLPYIYLGGAQDTLTISEFDTKTNSFSVSGNVWHDEYFDAAKETYLADTTHDWSVIMDYSESAYGVMKLSCEDPNAKGNYIVVKLSKNYNSDYLMYYPTMTVYYIKTTADDTTVSTSSFVYKEVEEYEKA